MKILTIGDVHGRKVWKNIVERYIDRVDKIIFTGDFADPYDKISEYDILEQVYEIFDFYDDYPDKVQFIWGNHDIHYLNDERSIASRYNPKLQQHLGKLYTEYKNKFKIAYKYKNYIWTHAGISETWAKRHKKLMEQKYNLKEDYSNIDDVLNNIFNSPNRHILSEIGFKRNGTNMSGGPLWCDLEELYNPRWIDIIPGYHQIVGHSQVRRISSVGNKNESVTFVDNLGYDAKPYLLNI